MSFKTVETVLEHSQSRGSARMVLVVIAECANHDGGEAWPAVETISHRAGISRASVFRCLKRLVDLGELAVESQGSRYGTNRYSVLLQTTLPQEIAAGHEGSQTEPSQDETGRIDAPKGSQTEPGPVSHMRPEPSEPSIEPPQSSKTPPNPLMGQIMAVLEETASGRGAPLPAIVTVERALADFPDRDHLTVAKEVRSWLLDSDNGRRAKAKDIASRYRNFLRRSDPAPVTAPRVDWAPWVAEHLPELHGAAAIFAAQSAAMLAGAGLEITPETVRARVERRLGEKEAEAA